MTNHDDPPAVGPPSRLLLDLGRGDLEPEEVEAIEQWLRADGLDEVPPWIQRRAERIVRQRQPARRRPAFTFPERARRLVAALAFDSQVQPQFVGLRAVQTRVRRLLFQAENIEVDLEMSPTPSNEQVRLAGQVTAGGMNPSGGFLRLSTASGQWMTTLDEAGEFWLDSLKPGAYRLEIVLQDRIIEVPVLPL